eukprot:330080-Alexandrium_andersonii.AAC.1
MDLSAHGHDGLAWCEECLPETARRVGIWPDALEPGVALPSSAQEWIAGCAPVPAAARLRLER